MQSKHLFPCDMSKVTVRMDDSEEGIPELLASRKSQESYFVDTASFCGAVRASVSVADSDFLFWLSKLADIEPDSSGTTK